MLSSTAILLFVLLSAFLAVVVEASILSSFSSNNKDNNNINNKQLHPHPPGFDQINLEGIPFENPPTFDKKWKTVFNHATVFVGIASFRDVECFPCVRDAYKKASNPRRLFLGIIEQNEHGDPNCIPPEFHKCFSPDFCPIDNIRRRRVAACKGRGPTYGRFVSMLSYRAENYYMMIDSHNEFVRHWELRSIMQILRSRSGRPVMSHYPNGWDKNGQDYESQGQMMVMCKGIFVANLGYVRNGASWMPRSIEPRIQPFTAAGYLFADARLVHEVPFDHLLDYIFDGEELLYTARLYTRGWDPHTPGDNIVFHDYNRHTAPRYWGTASRCNPSFHKEMTISQQRAQYILKVLKKDEKTGKFVPMISKENAKPRVVEKLDIFGLGKERTLEELYQMGDVHMEQKIANDGYCQSLMKRDRKFADQPVR